MRKRLWVLLILVTTTLIVVAAVAYVSSSAEPDWYEATSASGRYVAEFPGPPTTRTLTVPGSDHVLTSHGGRVWRLAYGLSEAPLNGADPRPLDEAVDDSIERPSEYRGRSHPDGDLATEHRRFRGRRDPRVHASM